MQWKNSVERYGVVARTLHWVIGIGILCMLVMGLIMTDMANSPLKFKIFSIHKATGITILFLAVLRLIWKLINWNLPRDLKHPWYEEAAATFVHWGFYALMIGMPLTGWILTGAANSTINWFGLFPVPNIAQPDPDLKHAMAYAHGTIANIIWVFIALHVLGALKHVVIDKDSTLRRMVPFMTPVFLLFMMVPAHGEPQAPFPQWTIDRAHSTLTFSATQEGTAFNGKFSAFDGTVMLDPDHPEAGNARITIDLASFSSQNDERDSTVKGPDWFDTKTSPTATYTITKFEKSGTDGSMIADGNLHLRGIDQKLNLPFTMTVTNDAETGVKTAHCVGSTVVKRLDFGVGGGQWADPKEVGTDVTVKVDLTMTAPKPL